MISREALHDQFQASAAELNLHCDVLSDGPVDSSVVFIGEGPGESEVRQGKVFIGGSGSILFNGVGKYGFKRSNVYTTNVVKRQISLSRKGNERHAVSSDELEKWISLVHWELSLLPNVSTVFVLGNYALEALLGHQGITNWRGSVIETELPNGRMGRVVCTFNPAYVMPGREPRFEPIFYLDCHKLHLASTGRFKPHHVDQIINPTAAQARKFIRDLGRQKKPVAFDIEAINGQTACYGIGNDAHQAMCIALRDTSRNVYTVQEEADILLDLQKLCDSHKFIAQNGGFDAYWCRLKDLLSVRVWFDTLLAHHCMYPLLPHSLGFLTAQYTNHPFYKDEGKNWQEGGDIDSFWRYNCNDVAITYACYERLERELSDQGLKDFFQSHIMRAQPHLVSATVHGVAKDKSIQDKIRELCVADVEVKKKEFWRLVEELTDEPGYEPNPNSWQQLQELFFDRLGLQGKGRSTDEANRTNIMNNQYTSGLAKEMLVALNAYKVEDKFLGTYVNSKVSEDGRFRSEYKQYGVAKAPGRLSSSALLTGEGGNIQNQPVRARTTFVSDPGTVFFYFDLAQAEARVVAYRANIPRWKQQFEQARLDGKFDCHRALAAEMFKIKYDDVPLKDWDEDNEPTTRYIAKRCRHGLNYRMEKWKLAEVTELPYHAAARAFVLYHGTTPQLMEWWKEEERCFREERQVFNALGRRFKAVQRLDDTVLDSLIAFYPQSTIGDKVTQVWYQSEKDSRWPHDARICIDVHDNLIGMASPKTAKTALAICKKYAESPLVISNVFKHKPEKLVIPAECKLSYPTKAIFKKDGKIDFKEAPDGLHRWSHMKVVSV